MILMTGSFRSAEVAVQGSHHASAVMHTGLIGGIGPAATEF